MKRRHFHAGIVSGVLALAGKLCGRPRQDQEEPEPPDFRLTALRVFSLGRPAWKYCQSFIDAADSYELDWRLLPALCFVETGGGQHVRHRNNWFGWRSGKAKFATVHDAIETVAKTLAIGRRYKDKTLPAKLHVYNTHHGYASKVLHVMGILSNVRKEVECGKR